MLRIYALTLCLITTVTAMGTNLSLEANAQVLASLTAANHTEALTSKLIYAGATDETSRAVYLDLIRESTTTEALQWAENMFQKPDPSAIDQVIASYIFQTHGQYKQFSEKLLHSPAWNLYAFLLVKPSVFSQLALTSSTVEFQQGLNSELSTTQTARLKQILDRSLKGSETTSTPTAPSEEISTLLWIYTNQTADVSMLQKFWDAQKNRYMILTIVEASAHLRLLAFGCELIPEIAQEKDSMLRALALRYMWRFRVELCVQERIQMLLTENPREYYKQIHLLSHILWEGVRIRTTNDKVHGNGIEILQERLSDAAHSLKLIQ